jgi:hypothetical protein
VRRVECGQKGYLHPTRIRTQPDVHVGNAIADGSWDLYLQPEKFRVQFAADLPETETKLALTQRPFAERAMTEASDVAAWKAIPSWFIFGTRDNSIPVNLLAFMAERAGSKKTVTIVHKRMAAATTSGIAMRRNCAVYHEEAQQSSS